MIMLMNMIMMVTKMTLKMIVMMLMAAVIFIITIMSEGTATTLTPILIYFVSLTVVVLLKSYG